jgi:hypothetical protein
MGEDFNYAEKFKKLDFEALSSRKRLLSNAHAFEVSRTLSSWVRDTQQAREHNSEVMVVFRNIENMIAKAEKFVWIISNQVLASTIPFLSQDIERGGQFRLLMPKDYAPTEDMRRLVTNPGFHIAYINNKLENRFLDKVDLFLCFSEKEVAALGFPNLEGKIDYAGFRGGR